MVQEYFLFDPLGDYLAPPLQGYRLRRGQYTAIRAVKGRLPSQVLGLHLESTGKDLRLFDSATGNWLVTPREKIEQVERSLEQAEAENECLRREVDELRRRLQGK